MMDVEGHALGAGLILVIDLEATCFEAPELMPVAMAPAMRVYKRA